MKTRYVVTLSMLAGAALGVAAIQGLHAQAKPPVYLVAEIDVTNPEAYAKEYAPKVRNIIKAAGGRFLAIGGAPLVIEGAPPATKVTAFEGKPPKRLVIQVWDSMEQIQAYRASPEFKEARKIGHKYAKFRSFAVEGLPQ